MFYYRLDFHDLAPDSFLHISTFIVVCEAFLRITPHFSLWIKTFNVKPKMMDGQHAECGGAIISKGVDVLWTKGSFPEVSDPWQREWFYITASRGRKWAAALPSDPHLRHSLHHGSTRGWTGDLIKKDTNLVKVIQVMLVRRVLPCQR